MKLHRNEGPVGKGFFRSFDPLTKVAETRTPW